MYNSMVQFDENCRAALFSIDSIYMHIGMGDYLPTGTELLYEFSKKDGESTQTVHPKVLTVCPNIIGVLKMPYFFFTASYT